MAAYPNRYYRRIARLVKSPEDKILYPDQWYDKDIPFLVSDYGYNIPINRIVAMFCSKSNLDTGDGTTGIFWIDETKNPNNSDTREGTRDLIEKYGFERWDKEWWKLQRIYKYGGYELKNRLKEDMGGWNETICDPRCKNHHLWYLMWNEPSKLQYIEPGDNDVIWGNIGEVDYNDLFL
jgi:hypothetical protein